MDLTNKELLTMQKVVNQALRDIESGNAWAGLKTLTNLYSIQAKIKDARKKKQDETDS